ncbi:MAG: DUF3108 domain-containing protein [Acidobacteria bacterium]|nr:DUF3108 domain-containing protein [Acidobacteriota bacterium]
MIFTMHRRGYVGFVVLFLCALIVIGASAEGVRQAADVPVRLPFASREELVYEGEFTKSLLRSVDIAELRFTATLEPVGPISKPQGNGEAGKSLRLTLDAVSKGLLGKLFGLRFRQHIESTVDPASFTVLQTTKLDEQGDRRRTSEAIFDRTAGKVVWTERDPNNPTREPRVVSSDFNGAVQDLASIFYFLRTQPLAPGQSLEITISDSGRIYRVPVKVVEKRRMKSLLGEVSVIRVEPDVFGEGRLLRGRGKMAIWFTDDARHIPVRARISNEMGMLDIKLKSITGAAKG